MSHSIDDLRSRLSEPSVDWDAVTPKELSDLLDAIEAAHRVYVLWGAEQDRSSHAAMNLNLNLSRFDFKDPA